MRGAGDHFSVGERIAFYRRRRGMTQRVLANLVGRSEDWLSKVERNERDVRRLDVIGELAKALRVSAGDLLGNPVLVEADRAKEDDVPAVRDALMSHRRLSQTLFGRPMREPVDPAPVARLAEHGWSDYQSGQLGRVIAALPGLIASAQALEESAPVSDTASCWAASARIHHLAASALAKVGESELAWMSAERAMSAAEQSGDPLSLASAARAGTHALLSVGRFDDAVQLGQTAADWLAGQIRSNDPAALSIVGMLYLRTASAAARRQDRAGTSELLSAATGAARRLGRDANYWHTSFGPTNVALYRLSTGLDLGDVLYVIERVPRWTRLRCRPSGPWHTGSTSPARTATPPATTTPWTSSSMPSASRRSSSGTAQSSETPSRLCTAEATRPVPTLD